MRRVAVIVTILAIFAGVPPALGAKKRICQTTYVTGETLGWKIQCGPYADWRNNNCKVRLNNGGIQYCYDADVPPTPTAPWRGSASGYGQAIQQ
jgi:hypothetical protein